jgi:hypothetical protein
MSTTSGHPESTITTRDSSRVAVAGLTSAVSGLVALLLAAVVLSQKDAAYFMLFWSALYVPIGILNGLALETTRSLSTTSLTSTTRLSGTPMKKVIPVAVAAVAVAALALSPTWRFSLPTGDPASAWALAAAIVLGLCGTAGHMSFTGGLAGARLWRSYAATVMANGLLRVLLMGSCALGGGGLVALAFAAAVPEHAWLGVLALSRRARSVTDRPTDAPPGVFVRRALKAMLGQGASALLVVGFPWLLGLTTGTADKALAAPLFLSITLTRAPLMVPLAAFQNVAVAHFSRHRGSASAASRLLGLVATVGLVGAGLAWLIGPWCLSLIKPDYTIGGLILAGLTLGATAIALLTLTGILAQSQTKYRVYLAGWLIAVGAAVAFLLTPFSMATRAILALVGGPLIGVAVHLVGLPHQRTIPDHDTATP